MCREIGESHHVGCLLLPRIVGSKTKVVGERYLCATRSPTMPRPLRTRHSRDAARARSHHRNRLRAALQGRRRHSSSSLHVLRFLGAAPCICACNQIEWLLAPSALWDGSAAGGGACSALVGLHSLAPLLRASLGAHAALLVTCCACYQIEWLLASYRPCGMVVQQEAVLATLWLLGSNCWLLCNVLRRWRLYVRAVCTRG